MRRFLALLSLVCLAYTATPLCVAAQDAPQAAQEDVSSMASKLERTRAIIAQAHTDGGTVASSTSSAPASVDEGPSLMKLFQAMGLIIALLLVGVWATKKYIIKEIPQSQRTIRILEKVALSQKASLFVAEVGNTKILVGTSGESVSLMRLDDALKSQPIRLTEAV